jgi:hypothetical protein
MGPAILNLKICGFLVLLVKMVQITQALCKFFGEEPEFSGWLVVSFFPLRLDDSVRGHLLDPESKRLPVLICLFADGDGITGPDGDGGDACGNDLDFSTEENGGEPWHPDMLPLS